MLNWWLVLVGFWLSEACSLQKNSMDDEQEAKRGNFVY